MLAIRRLLVSYLRFVFSSSDGGGTVSLGYMNCKAQEKVEVPNVVRRASANRHCAPSTCLALV